MLSTNNIVVLVIMICIVISIFSCLHYSYKEKIRNKELQIKYLHSFDEI